MKKFLQRRISATRKRVSDWSLRRRNEDIAVAVAVDSSSRRFDFNFPTAYTRFVRDSLCPQRHRLQEVKHTGASDGESARRFTTLLNVLGSDVPPLPMDVAENIGHVCDGLLSNTDAAADSDIAEHFAISSSSARVGRLLTSIVRVMRSCRGLELGTAYGISALFILAALRKNYESARLTTLEAFDPQFTLAARMLDKQYRGSVICHKGMTADVLPRIVEELAPIDFLFHDAGHSYQAYVEDFRLVEPVLAAGSTLLMDDIRWNDRRYADGDPRTYAGWRAVVANDRVERAVEIDGEMGMLLLR